MHTTSYRIIGGIVREQVNCAEIVTNARPRKRGKLAFERMDRDTRSRWYRNQLFGSPFAIPKSSYNTLQ
jgi:hypothetical protein